MQIGDVRWDDVTHDVHCVPCGARLCADDQNWKAHALVRRGNAAERLNGGGFGDTYRLYEHAELELAEIFCPACKALLSVELYLRGEPLRWSWRSLAVAARQGYDPVAEFAADPTSWISFGGAR
ncbi:MAG: acetone carboxylase subunit gamma [Gammaproteobacteria bacterium]